jgi:ribosome-associated protein
LIEEEYTASDLADRIAELAIDKKGFDIKILDLQGISTVTDFFVVVSGDASVQVDAIAGWIEDELKKQGIRPSSREGLKGGRWVLLDYFDVVAHIFHQPVREFYALEKLWGDAPTKEITLE